MEIYQKDFNIDYKEDRSPVMVADIKANDIIIKHLKEKFPTMRYYQKKVQMMNQD